MAEKVVIVGSLNMDLVACAARIPVLGETITGHTYFDEPGGKGANQAYAVARLGGRAAMLGRVGSDDFGRRMRENLRQVGCDVSELKTIPDSASGIALIFVADDGHNSIIIVPGANNRLSPQDVDAEKEHLLRGAGLVLLQLENPLPTVLAAARAGRAVGAPRVGGWAGVRGGVPARVKGNGLARAARPRTATPAGGTSHPPPAVPRAGPARAPLRRGSRHRRQRYRRW